MIEMTYDKVLETLKEVVEEEPDYVYTSPPGIHTCSYVHYTEGAGEPGCVVAHVLYRLGVSLEYLKGYEGDSAYAVMQSLYHDRKMKFPVRYDFGRTRGLLSLMQNYQDGKTLSWSECLEQTLVTEAPGTLDDMEN